VVLPKTLSGNIINIKVNDTINLESILELFGMYGFVRSDFVYEPGQYALRGGILDIYSFGNEKPYRVELFGNEVDSIRIFDPETQLSERKLLQVSIIPNVETQFETGDKVSLLEFLPENTTVWLKDWDVIKEKIEVQEEDLGMFLERLKADAVHLKEESDRLKAAGFTRKAAAMLDHEDEDEDDTKILKEVSLQDFSPAATLERQIQQRHIVEFGYKPQFATTEIEFNTRSQPSFNRQFDLLIKDLKAHEAAKYSIYIFAEQAKQLERLHSIFTDLKTEIQFTPVATSIHEGFIDEDLKVVYRPPDIPALP
jgi:transcription-repair coupling factor (superfamily II helicase)